MGWLDEKRPRRQILLPGRILLDNDCDDDGWIDTQYMNT
jgi:hypothetical protein